jgi:hypothetical protein
MAACDLRAGCQQSSQIERILDAVMGHDLSALFRLLALAPDKRV